MEAIITIVGFLGAGKTTLLKYLIEKFSDKGWSPFVILNDYEYAYIDAQQLTTQIDLKNIKALSGSCICCNGIEELRNAVNRIPKRENGITFIEANGTTDACRLVEFLGVGINDRFLPPIQISVIDVKNWQKREAHNELEANQIQVSSLLILSHIETISKKRKTAVIQDLKQKNPTAKIVTLKDLDILLLPELLPSKNLSKILEHQKAHWSSCSIDLPLISDKKYINEICKSIPKSILRIKGCAKIKGDDNYTFFERKPDGEVFIRPFNGIPITGTKLLSIGPGSDPLILDKIIQSILIKE
ncbi:MAG: GTP-binding protein [Polaribacter sp.]|uniref:GTP-binding protein n=1 Tax=Polaribacter sp. TaxID=1920175 RepID=UPI0032632EDC